MGVIEISYYVLPVLQSCPDQPWLQVHLFGEEHFLLAPQDGLQIAIFVGETIL